MNSKSSEYRNL